MIPTVMAQHETDEKYQDSFLCTQITNYKSVIFCYGKVALFSLI